MFQSTKEPSSGCQVNNLLKKSEVILSDNSMRNMKKQQSTSKVSLTNKKQNPENKQKENIRGYDIPKVSNKRLYTPRELDLCRRTL
jgi:hypothetical protein